MNFKIFEILEDGSLQEIRASMVENNELIEMICIHEDLDSADSEIRKFCNHLSNKDLIVAPFYKIRSYNFETCTINGNLNE